MSDEDKMFSHILQLIFASMKIYQREYGRNGYASGNGT